MRNTEARDVQARDTKASVASGPFWKALSRGMRLAIVAAGIGLVMTASAARAADDEDADDETFEQKIIGGIMRGIGGTNMENRGIEYRERSPLVVPPKLDLPPPASSAEINAPNWPKDTDEQRRKAAAAARKVAKPSPEEAARPLMPSELNQRTAKRTGGGQVESPGSIANMGAVLSPSQLGYNSGLLGLFGGSSAETATFKGEPTRETLTQPPPGYQTPSSNFAYGTGPRESLIKDYNPAAGKYGD